MQTPGRGLKLKGTRAATSCLLGFWTSHADPEHTTRIGRLGTKCYSHSRAFNHGGICRNRTWLSSATKSTARSKLNPMISHPRLPWKKMCSLKYYVVTKHEHVAQACSCSRCIVLFPCISDQANAQSTNETCSSLTNTVCQQATDQIWPGETGWIHTVVLFCAAVCLWLPNEALLIQIRVNDYLIIPILQRAPSASVLCPVNLQRSNPVSVSCHETLICHAWSGQTSNMNKSYMFLQDSAITWNCFKSVQTTGICFIYF